MTELHHVSKVYQTNHVPLVNSYLEAGWTLINIANGQEAQYGEPMVKYCLGWCRSGEPTEPNLKV